MQTMPVHYSRIASPLGELVVLGDGQSITGLYLPGHQGWEGPCADCQPADELFSAVRIQLAEYFAGDRQQFDLPLHFSGTDFQQRIWRELLKIPFGSTVSYTELASCAGQPYAARAAGHANGRNPISLIVPCHRVIGASGQLTGYAGGVDKKRWLLDFEASRRSRE